MTAPAAPVNPAEIGKGEGSAAPGAATVVGDTTGGRDNETFDECSAPQPPSTNTNTRADTNLNA